VTRLTKAATAALIVALGVVACSAAHPSFGPEADAGIDCAPISTADASEAVTPPPLCAPDVADAGYVCTTNSQTASLTPLSYKGGAELAPDTVNIYFLWYGQWAQNYTRREIVEAFIPALSGSPWLALTTTLCGVSGCPAGTLNLAASVEVGAALGYNLTDDDLQEIVISAISTGLVANDPNGIYFILTSSDVADSIGGLADFCGFYCGYHQSFNYAIVPPSADAGDDAADAGADDAANAAPIHAVTYHYAFVGDPSDCLYGCTAQSNIQACGYNSPPNGDWGADGMVSVIAHEISESVTDPSYPTGWTDLFGFEMADKCAWMFDPVYAVDVGPDASAAANMTLGGRNWLIQENWYNEPLNLDGGGYCTLAP
jgi:hypothetical protein